MKGEVDMADVTVNIPKFVAAFQGNRKISEKEAKEIKAMIDSHKERGVKDERNIFDGL